MTDELHERFQRLQDTGAGDWGDVLRRAGKRRGRRRLVAAAAFAAIVALTAPTALALRGSIVDFFRSEPAPKRVVLDFAGLDADAPPGLETGVIAEQTRRILHRRGYDGRELTLYVAPSRKGGFCTYLEGGMAGGGCGPGYSVPVAPAIGIRGPITREGVIRGGPVVISGSVQIADADAIELRYEDGAGDRQRLTWVSQPIGAAFFVFDVPPAHWNGVHQPKELVVFDADGRTLRTEPLRFERPRRFDSETGAPSEALVGKGRKLITLRTHTGTEAALWVAPTEDGRRCYWLRYGEGGFGGSCPAKSSRRPFGLVSSQGGGVVLFWGGPLRKDIAEVQVRYEDGERDLVRVVDGMALWEVRPSHLERGHRVESLTVRDAEGRAVARQKLQP